MEIKIGRKTLIITDKDIFMDNGSCVQLITRKERKDYYEICYRLSKKLWKQLKKHVEITQYKDINYTGIKLTYYKLKEVKCQIENVTQ